MRSRDRNAQPSGEGRASIGELSVQDIAKRAFYDMKGLAIFLLALHPVAAFKSSGCEMSFSKRRCSFPPVPARANAVSMQNSGASSDEEQPMVMQLFDPDFGDECDEIMPMMYLHDFDDDDDDDDYYEDEPPPAMVSPFSPDQGGPVTADDNAVLSLTEANVERALDEVRPYLLADGGNVKLKEIDGPDVVLELEGACAGCASSAMTMKMGIERKLKDRIPEISEVRQVSPESEELSLEAVDTVLEAIRPFITVADKNAKLEVVDIEGPHSVQPVVKLLLESKIAVVKSVKEEIMSRVRRQFANPGLRIVWEEK